MPVSVIYRWNDNVCALFHMEMKIYSYKINVPRARARERERGRDVFFKEDFHFSENLLCCVSSRARARVGGQDNPRCKYSLSTFFTYFPNFCFRRTKEYEVLRR